MKKFLMVGVVLAALATPTLAGAKKAQFLNGFFCKDVESLIELNEFAGKFRKVDDIIVGRYASKLPCVFGQIRATEIRVVPKKSKDSFELVHYSSGLGKLYSFRRQEEKGRMPIRMHLETHVIASEE